jgi:hypothetical protein
MTEMNSRNAKQKEKGQGSEKTHRRKEREIPKCMAGFAKREK